MRLQSTRLAVAAGAVLWMAASIAPAANSGTRAAPIAPVRSTSPPANLVRISDVRVEPALDTEQKPASRLTFSSENASPVTWSTSRLPS